jgi:hypothetical protein
VDDDPFSVTFNAEQEIGPDAVALTLAGAVIFCLTLAVSEEVQPFTGLVTINV